MLKPLTLSDFLPVVGRSFQVQAPPDTSPNPSLHLELLEAVTLSDSAAQDTIPSGTSSTSTSASAFSLLFKGPADTPLPQQIYHLNHPTLGELGIFLVPVGCKPDGMRYEAIFA